MAAIVLVLIVIQLCWTVAQSNTTTAHPSAHNASIKDFQECLLNKPMGYNWPLTVYWAFTLKGQLSGSTLSSIEKPVTDLWTSQCEVAIYGDPIPDDRNPLEVLRSNITSVIIMHTSITGFKSGYFCHFYNVETLILNNNRLNDTAKIGINVNSECSRKSCFNHLRFLSLNGNPLRVIKNNSFCGLDKVNELQLNNCELDSIESGAFLPLTQLHRLHLSNNHLNRLPSQLFPSNITLYEFFMAFNNFDAVPHIENSVGLKRIHLNNNVIKSVRKFDFDNCTRFTEINLSHNVISSIEDGAFDGGCELNVLDLSNNRLQTFDEKLFRLNIKKLHLNNNQLTRVILDDLGFHITELHLKGNRISQLNSHPFKTGRSGDGRALSLIDLSNNNLTVVKNLFLPKFVKTIIMNNNNMNYISFDENLEWAIMTSDTSLQEVRLQNNSFHYVPLLPNYCKDGLIADVHYHFHGNPLKCLCENTWFLETSIISAISTGLSCQPSTEITAKHLFPKTNVLSTNQLCESSYNNSYRCRSNHLDFNLLLLNPLLVKCPFRSFQCQFKCPPPCYCYTTFNFTVVHLYCSQTQLQSIPRWFDNEKLSSESEVILWLDGNDFNTINSTDFDIFINVVKLYLNHSRIHAIDPAAFNNLKVLRVLSLNDNDLQSLPLGLFDDVIVLQELYLANNKLTDLSDDMFKNVQSLQILHLHKNHFSDYPVWNLKNVLSLKEVTLHKNIWTCECSFVMKFRDYLINHTNTVYNNSLIECIDQDGLSSTTSILNFDASVCSYVDNVIMWASIGSACVLLIISVSLSFYYRRELQLLVYSRVRRRVLSNVNDSEGKLFDVFVAYCNDDFDFMYNNILPGLEGVDNPYRVCVHERDFLAGCVIADNILEAVRISSRTIILLTDNFVRSGWCRFEFKAAHLQMLEDRCPRVLVIVVDRIPTDLEPDMKLYLRTNTYLTWGESFFWQKLHNAMPKQRATGVGVERSPNLMPLEIEFESSI